MDPRLELALRGLDALLLLATRLPEIRAEIERQRNVLGRIAAENRDPTPEEWAELDAKQEELRRKLHGG